MHNILFFGSDSESSTSRHRADALRRLGHNVFVLDPILVTSTRNRVQSYVDYRTGFRLLSNHFLNLLQFFLQQLNTPIDIAWIDRGEYLSSKHLNFLRTKLKCRLLLFNVDDPLGHRDWLRFTALRRALPAYDLCVFVRQETSLDALAAGAQRVLTVNRSYDECYHHREHISQGAGLEKAVTFIGTNIPGEGRAIFLRSLIDLNLNLVLYGDGWKSCNEWQALMASCLGPSLTLSSYSDTINRSYISLGLLSHHNRDLVTQRSFEIPASAGLLCAELTSEHQLFLENGVEALFWSTAEDCVEQCRYLMGNPLLRDLIATNGHQAIQTMGVGNEDICRHILLHLLES
jgi:spore maturation protein CgeB